MVSSVVAANPSLQYYPPLPPKSQAYLPDKYTHYYNIKRRMCGYMSIASFWEYNNNLYEGVKWTRSLFDHLFTLPYSEINDFFLKKAVMTANER